MNRAIPPLVAVLALVAIAGSATIGLRLERAQKSTSESIARLQARLDASERQAMQTRQQLALLNLTPARSAATTPPQSPPPAPEVVPVEATPPSEPPKIPDGPITTNALRDVVVTVDTCVLANRTLRCNFTVTNQSAAEKKFTLGIGGASSRFENTQGGACVFDDIGNDFLSAGGGVGNRAQPNCDNWVACTVEKTLTPAVKTAGWLRFDAVDPKASLVKLLRVKWSDGDAWVAMDFRNIPITGQADRP